MEEVEPQSKEKNAADWVKKFENRDADAAAKIRDDPLLAMIAAEKAERDKILNNPLKIKQLKREVEKDRQKKKRKHMDAESEEEEQYDRQRKYGLISRPEKRSRSPTYSSRGRHDKKQNHRSSRSLDRDTRTCGSRHSPARDRSNYRKGYHHQKRYSSPDHIKRSERSGTKLSKEEQEAKLRQMQADAELLDAKRRERVREDRHAREKEEAEYQIRQNVHLHDVEFLNDLSKQVFLKSEDSLEDRLNRNKHYLQRSHQVRSE